MAETKPISGNSEVKPVSTSGSYKVESVLLLESHFVRNTTDLDDRVLSNQIQINSEPFEGDTDNKFAVIVTIDFKGKQNEVIVCSSIIKMMGFFEKIGEPALTEESFKKVNAPAIIYPFIREHLHNICLKAGIANVLLPTVNFKV